MLNANWEEEHGMNLPIQVPHVGNMIHQPRQGFSDNDHLAASSTRRNVAALPSSGSTSVYSFDNQFHQQNLLSEARPIDYVCSQTEDHKSLHPLKSCSTDAEKSLVGSNVQDLIKFLSANYGPMKTPLKVGTPEYMKLVEILQQSSVQPNSIHEGTIEDEISKDKQEKILGHDQKNDVNLGIAKTDEKAEKLWEGFLQLSSSVTLTAVAFFKSGEKLVGNKWPESIEVKGKVRLEAFEKYVKDLPRSRNRGLMVISVCWKEGSSKAGLTGMKEVAKGYKKSSRVGFAQLLPGIDLYICPRTDPIITILAKYGFFKGMSVINDKPDSMIGCVVWRKNRPLNQVGNTTDSKTSPNNSTQPQNSPSGLSIKNGAEKQAPGSSQHDEPLTFPSTTNSESSRNIASADVDHNEGSSVNSVRKRAFEDEDLPEFDFGKSTLASKTVSSDICRNNSLKLENSRLTQPLIAINVSLKKTKLFDDDDDDMPEWCPPKLHHQLPPQTTISSLHTLPPRPPLPPIPPPPQGDTHPSFSYQMFRPAITSPLPPPPPPPPLPPPPHLPPPSSSLGGFSSNQALWHRPGSSNVNSSFLSSKGRRPPP